MTFHNDGNPGAAAEIYSAIGNLQFELGHYQGAAQCYQKLLSVEPANIEGKFHLALCLEKMGRWAEAAAQFGSLLDVDPGRLDARLGLAICQLHLEQAVVAAENFRRVLEQTPDDQLAVSGCALATQLARRLDDEGSRF